MGETPMSRPAHFYSEVPRVARLPLGMTCAPLTRANRHSKLVERVAGEIDFVGLVVLVDDDTDALAALDVFEQLVAFLHHVAGRAGGAEQFLELFVRQLRGD